MQKYHKTNWEHTRTKENETREYESIKQPEICQINQIHRQKRGRYEHQDQE